MRIMGPLLVVGFFLLLFIFVSLMLIFWIWMIVDCAKRDFKKNDDKVIWILILVFLGVIGAIIYYFIIKRKNKKEKIYRNYN